MTFAVRISLSSFLLLKKLTKLISFPNITLISSGIYNALTSSCAAAAIASYESSARNRELNIATVARIPSSLLLTEEDVSI